MGGGAAGGALPGSAKRSSGIIGGGAAAPLAMGRPPPNIVGGVGGEGVPLALPGGGGSGGDGGPGGGGGNAPGEGKEAPGDAPEPRRGSELGVAAPDLAGDCSSTKGHSRLGTSSLWPTITRPRITHPIRARITHPASPRYRRTSCLRRPSIMASRPMLHMSNSGTTVWGKDTRVLTSLKSLSESWLSLADRVLLSGFVLPGKEVA